MNRGFSLVELSIVLVILGLLTGGILAGQSLIRAAELRAVTTEYNRYVTAAQTFRDKYFAIPGDFRDATKFWGLQVVGSGCVSNSGLAVASTPGACDGNGNGTLIGAGAASEAGENHQYWRHLATAGLIEGTYSGLAGAGGGNEVLLGTNAPRSKLGQAGWSARSMLSYFAGNASDFASDFGNFYTFGGYQAGTYASDSALKPEEAWNIDTKVDDGKPGTGKVLGSSRSGCANSTSVTDYAATYRLDTSTIICTLYLTRAF